MKIQFVFMLSLFYGIASGAVFRGNYSDPRHPGKCVIEPAFILEPGEHRHPSKCELITCYADGTTLHFSCGVVDLPNGCTLGKYKYPKASYPECCERHVNCTIFN